MHQGRCAHRMRHARAARSSSGHTRRGERATLQVTHSCNRRRLRLPPGSSVGSVDRIPALPAGSLAPLASRTAQTGSSSNSPFSAACLPSSLSVVAADMHPSLHLAPPSLRTLHALHALHLAPCAPSPLPSLPSPPGTSSLADFCPCFPLSSQLLTDLHRTTKAAGLQ